MLNGNYSDSVSSFLLHRLTAGKFLGKATLGLRVGMFQTSKRHCRRNNAISDMEDFREETAMLIGIVGGPFLPHH